MKFKTIKTILFVFVLLILAYAVYMAYADISKNFPKSKTVTTSISERFEDNKDNTASKLKICLYTAEWCHFCKSYKQSNIFNDTYSSIKKNDMYNGVVFATLDFDQNKAMAEKYNVNSFPTIIAVDSKGNLLDTFSGDRSDKDELVGFVDKNLNKLS